MIAIPMGICRGAQPPCLIDVADAEVDPMHRLVPGLPRMR